MSVRDLYQYATPRYCTGRKGFPRTYIQRSTTRKPLCSCNPIYKFPSGSRSTQRPVPLPLCCCTEPCSWRLRARFGGLTSKPQVSSMWTVRKQECNRRQSAKCNKRRQCKAATTRLRNRHLSFREMKEAGRARRQVPSSRLGHQAGGTLPAALIVAFAAEAA